MLLRHSEDEHSRGRGQAFFPVLGHPGRPPEARVIGVHGHPRIFLRIFVLTHG